MTHSPRQEGGGASRDTLGLSLWAGQAITQGPVTHQPLLSLHLGLSGHPEEGGSERQHRQPPGQQIQAGSPP